MAPRRNVRNVRQTFSGCYDQMDISQGVRGYRTGQVFFAADANCLAVAVLLQAHQPRIRPARTIGRVVTTHLLTQNTPDSRHPGSDDITSVPQRGIQAKSLVLCLARRVSHDPGTTGPGPCCPSPSASWRPGDRSHIGSQSAHPQMRDSVWEVGTGGPQTGSEFFKM